MHDNQTYKSLGIQYNVSSRTIQRRLDQISASPVIRVPKTTAILMDTCYFGRSFGVMVFRDNLSKQNLYWKYVIYETIESYRQGIIHLQSKGWNITGIVCDGRRGIFPVFNPIPIQMCQFHQVAIITRYITRRPKLDAGKELKTILSKLPGSNQVSFENMIDTWYLKWKNFLAEKTLNPETGRWHFTHRRIRSACRSLKTNMPYLFTYLEYPNLDIPNTTNSLEGVFSNLKIKLQNHRGLKRERKIRFINEILAK